MMMQEESSLPNSNPTEGIDLDFGRYLETRKRELAEHTAEGGIADYSFSLDHNLRRRMAALSPARMAAQALVALAVPIQKQLHAMEAIAVGPRQYPEIHALGEDCARRLGIGVPRIFLKAMPPGAFTIATDDVAPIIVLSTALVSSLTPDELQFVIGHECGHIHNLHGVYNTAAELLANPLAQGLVQQVLDAGAALKVVLTTTHVNLVAGLVQEGLKHFFLHWSRCAEITCDRAGVICCGDVAAAERALMKIVTGGGSALDGFNVDEYLRQLDEVRSSPFRFQEFQSTHPLILKRIEAIRSFASCEVLHAWRPELGHGQARTKEETDEICRRIVSILATGASNPEAEAS